MPTILVASVVMLIVLTTGLSATAAVVSSLWTRHDAAFVRFAPGARTAWHSHARGQYLHVTVGTARLGTRDGTVVEVATGQTIYTPPGEEHWHAATEDGFVEHLALLERGDDPATTTTWHEHVSDETYRGESLG